MGTSLREHRRRNEADARTLRAELGRLERRARNGERGMERPLELVRGALGRVERRGTPSVDAA